jgi:hypothetical protein
VLDVSMRAPHNVAIAIAFGLLAGVTLLTMAPFELGTIRLAGVSLLWWYGVVVVPAVVIVTTVVLLVASLASASVVPASSPAPETE